MINFMANQEHIHHLIKQFTDGTISKKDYPVLMAHFGNAKNDDEVYLAMDKVWIPSDKETHHTAAEMNALYSKLINDKTFRKSPVIKLWPKLAIAASVVITLSIGLLFYVSNKQVANQQKTAHKNGINPGRNTATLTLASGRRVNLSDTKTGIAIKMSRLTYNDGTEIKEMVKGDALLMVATPRGGTYQVRLPDGTDVWLNALSTIKFPITFSKLKQRRVELIGEAYFEVKKNTAQPFIVSSAKQQIEVLGTHFNVNSYADEYSIKTTLLEGSVKISILNSSLSGYLKPGMQSTFNSSGIKFMHLADPEEAIAWKSGYFTFNRENLDQVMRKVSRWYDVNVIYKDESIKTIPFSGTITRFAQVSELLKMLEHTGKVQFLVEGKNIILNKK
jgi:transmembrane sensor